MHGPRRRSCRACGVALPAWRGPGAASARAGRYDAGQGRGLLRGRAHSGDPPGRRAQRSAQPQRAPKSRAPRAVGRPAPRDLTRSVVAGERAGSGGAAAVPRGGALATACLKTWPALNTTTRRGRMAAAAPVLGLRPVVPASSAPQRCPGPAASPLPLVGGWR